MAIVSVPLRGSGRERSTPGGCLMTRLHFLFQSPCGEVIVKEEINHGS